VPRARLVPICKPHDKRSDIWVHQAHTPTTTAEYAA
jgi:hypothetical protein